jgi:hypothetical protein
MDNIFENVKPMYFSSTINPLPMTPHPLNKWYSLLQGVVDYFLEQINHYSILSIKVKLFVTLQLDDSLENQALCFLDYKIFIFVLQKQNTDVRTWFLLSAVVHREGRCSGKLLTHRKRRKAFLCEKDFKSSGGDDIMVELTGSLNQRQVLSPWMKDRRGNGE